MMIIRLAVLTCLAGAGASFAEDQPMQITLSPRQIQRRGEAWVVQVKVTFTNTGKKVFQLDKLTAALSGTLSNEVFVVTSPAGPLRYLGEMAKRAPPGPGGFAKVAPGAQVEAVVDLGEVYAFPKEGGKFTLKFSSANHFSVDDVMLVSAPLVVELKP